jgi:hypothetical protein
MKQLKVVKVFRWISDTSYKVYVFDTNPNTVYDKSTIVMKYNIYQDDNIEYAATKIAYYISKTDDTIKLPFYVWKKQKPLLFEIDKPKWKGYHVNPFKSKDRNAEELKEPIVYKYTRGIFDLEHLNIVFFSDFNEKNKYYFTDYKTSLPNFMKREQVMAELYKKDVVHTKLASEIYHRIDLHERMKEPIILSNLFHSLHTTKEVQLIQLMNDNFRFMYKLYKKHKLPEKFLANVFNIDKTQHQNCINIFSVMTSGTYGKITIDNKGFITLSYILDLRSSVNWNDLVNNKKTLSVYVKNFAKQKIQFKENNIKVNLYYNIDNSSFAVLSKKIGEYIDIFHVLRLQNEKNKNKIVCVYKRSNNYNKDPINLNEYIKSRLDMGINDKELIQELINLGISDNDADNLVKNEIAALNAIKYNDLEQKLKIENTGTIVMIEKYKEGYIVDISNCPSKTELNNLIYWLTRIIETTRKIVKKEAAQPIILPVIYDNKNSSHSSANSHKSHSSRSEDDNIGNVDLDLGSDDDFFQGGALGKEKHGYFMNMLKQADKELFTENYARNKCQAAFQPLVLSKEEKDNLEKKDLLKYFDNIIEYGSKPHIKNYYTCPRLWCPVSKIPLDYSQENPTCPLENEEPMKLFWNKDKTKPRFVKLTKADENGASVPCCFKKEAKAKAVKTKDKAANVPMNPINTIIQKEQNKEKSSSKTVNADIDKEENYIMNKTAPIPIGRYGLVPESLFKLLFPNVNFALCSKTLNKTQKCLARRGIQHKTVKKSSNKDSILYALAYSLGFEDKQALVKDIKKRLDIVTFLSLENGHVCKDFLDTHPIIPEKNRKLCQRLTDAFKANKLFDMKEIRCKTPSHNLSRILNVFKAYTKFLDYLSSNDYPSEKGVYYLFSLTSILYDALLIIWEKTDNDIKIVCPLYTSFADILAGLQTNTKTVMILKDKSYYEPLELKLRNEEGDRLLNLNDYPNVKQIISECNKLSQTQSVARNKIIQNLSLLQQYAETQVYKARDVFDIEKVVINDDLTINKFILHSNIILKTPVVPISLLPTLIDTIGIKQIVFYDDIVGKTYDINLLKSDLLIFSNKIKQLNFDADLGYVNIDLDTEIYTKLTIKADNPSAAFIIHADTMTPYYRYIDETEYNTKKWFQLQTMVANKLVKIYDNGKLKELLKQNRTDIITTLLKHFKDIPEKKKIQIILEEIPLHSIEGIKKWVDDILLYVKYQYFSKHIKETSKEFLFSQYNVAESIPERLLAYHKYLPNILPKTEQTHFLTVKDQEKPIDDKLPILFDGTPERLKSKWLKHKKMIWYHMGLLRRKYTKNTIHDLFDWLCKILDFNLNFDEVRVMTAAKYLDMISDPNPENSIKENIFHLFQDPSFYSEYLKHMNALHKTNRKFKTLQIFMNTYYLPSSVNERQKIINALIEDDNVYPNDMHLITISQLLNVSFLILHRAKYGTFNETADDVKRGDIQDLKLSSSFFPAKTNIHNRPLLILSKEIDKSCFSYYAVVEKNKNIYMKLKEAPGDIRLLVEDLSKNS